MDIEREKSSEQSEISESQAMSSLALTDHDYSIQAAAFEEGSFEERQDPDQTLESFRAEWKRELEVSQERKEFTKEENQEKDIHKRARAFFEEGVALEQDGKLYDAIQFYKKAVHLVPDIEKEVYDNPPKACKMRSSSRVRGEDANHNPVETVEDYSDDENDLDNLIDRFNRTVCLDNKPYIQRECNTNDKHIGSLPLELLNLILKWVVSAELDLRSLENCACVCKGFYLAARDQEIWKQICNRAFGRSTLTGNTAALPGTLTWRQFYLKRAKIHFNGCYISKMSYLREGERGFQDHEMYRAWHMVTYYRLIRLFPGGRILMALSADDPSLTAKLMNNNKFCSIQGSLYGEYKVVDDKLVCVLHKTNKKEKKTAKNLRRKRNDAMIYHESPDQDFLIEFQIKGKRDRLLYWTNYDIITRYSSGDESTDPVTLNEQKFPRMQFTKVGSYHFESSGPL